MHVLVSMPLLGSIASYCVPLCGGVAYCVVCRCIVIVVFCFCCLVVCGGGALVGGILGLWWYGGRICRKGVGRVAGRSWGQNWRLLP